MQLIELDLVDGAAHDCVPQQMVLVESFDETKNTTFPDAKAFVMLQDGGHVVVSTEFETIGKAIQAIDPSDWFEVTNKQGNRMLLRRSLIISRRSTDDGSSMLIMTGGGQAQVEVKEKIADLRAVMSKPTLAAPPPGMQPLPVPSE